LEIAEQSYQLHRNHGQHCLHGGTANFDKALWQVTEQSQDSVLFELNYAEDTSALPGNLSVSARFSVANNSLEIEYTVTTDKATYVNLTNHLYLNLNGACEPIQNHQFSLYADGFLQADQDSIPTGNITAVENPLQYSLVDQSPYAQINHAADSHFVLNNPQTHNKLARAYSPLSKISAEVSSSKAGFQFYTGQFLAEPCQPFGGFCVEPQFAPNAINQTEFASPLTTPDKPYLHKIRFDFAWP
jgi:aldose 1-epimerase